MTINRAKGIELQGLNPPEELSLEDQVKLERLRVLADEAFAELDQGLGTELNGREQLEARLKELSPLVDAASRSENA
jgi:hypothetical protein